MGALLCAASAFADMPRNYDRIINDPPPRNIRIAESSTIPLVKDGKAVFEIILPENPAPIVRFAASELQRCVKAATGSEVPVTTVPSTGKTTIFLGDQKAAREAGIHSAAIPRDGFMIVAKGKNIFIAGVDDPKGKVDTRGWGLIYERGTLNGVYSFLERFFGVRFYFPGEIGTVIPKQQSLSIPEMTILDRPDYPRRRLLAGAAAAWFPEVDPKEEPRYWYTLRMETFYVPVCHSLERLKFADRFGREHPEYIGMDANGKRYLDKSSPYYGNICMTDPGLREELYKDAVAFLTGKNASERGLKGWDPSICQPGFFNIMPKDHFRDCECPRCRAFYQKHSKADLVWDLTADIGRRLIRNNIPGYITALAYGHYTETPKIDLPQNLLMMVSVRGPWAENTPARAEFDKRITDWKNKMNRKPWLWTAVYKYGGLELPEVPPATPKAVASYFSREADRISGTFMESATDHWLFSYLNYYFMAKSTWDTGLDGKAMLKEHHRLMFGAGAAPMEKFFDRVEDIWMNKIAGRIVETPLGSQAVPPSDYELWEKIYSPEQLKEFEAWFAEALKLAGKDKEAQKRIRYFEKYFLGQIRKGADAYRQTKLGVENWAYDVKPLAEGEPIVLDGILDDKAWKNAADAYLVPFKSDKAEVHTRFKMLRDAGNLYIGVQCDEPKMAEMVAECTKCDDPNLWRDSVVEIFLNPSGDRIHYYHFIINSNGVFYDAAAKKLGASGSSDAKWNSGMTVKTARNTKGWSLEAQIPLKELKGLDPSGIVGNIGRNRVIRSKAAVPLYSWSPYIKGFHDLENFGKLHFDAPSDEKLIENGDFTVPFAGRFFGGWWADQDEVKQGFIAYDAQTFRKGGQSLRIRNDGQKRRLVTQWLPKLKSNTSYRLTYDLKMEDVKASEKDGGIAVNIGAPGNIFYPKNHYFGSMPWTSQGMTFKTGVLTEKHPAFIRLQFFPGTGTVWFDNLQLKEIK